MDRQPSGFRFGIFELDVRAGELRRNGLKVRIQDQPFRVLALLLERRGEVVTRDDLRRELWPEDTFVEFDHSLNTAVNKAREALGDGAENPRYIATVPRRGYRFLAPVEPVFDTAAEEAETTTVAPAQGGSWRLRALAGAAVLVLVIVVAALLRSFRAEEILVAERFTIVTPELATTPVISPNGRHVAYVCGLGDNARLCVQDLDRFEPRKMPSSSRVELHPFWSPDSQRLAFASGGALWIIPAGGGTPVQVCKLPGAYLGGTWDRDGSSIFFAIDHQGMFELPGLKGTPKLVIPLDRQRWGTHIETPAFLPPEYGRVLLYGAQNRNRVHVTVLHDLQSGKTEIVAPNGMAAFSPTGHVVYPHHLNVWAAPISPDTLKAGAAFPIGRSGPGIFPSLSTGGTLAYLQLDNYRRLVWLDRSGKLLGEDQGAGELIWSFALSPDGTRAAVSVSTEDSSADIWIWDLERRTRTRLTFGPARDGEPVWNPAGDTITFTSNRNGNPDIFQQPADGSGTAAPLLATARDEVPEAWSADGKLLFYRVIDPKQKTDIWFLKAKGDGSGHISTPYVQTPFRERGADLSPDGRFLAYFSDQSGRDEVFVQEFPEGERHQISGGGGRWPRWGRDGRELFYLSGDSLMRVPIRASRDFSAGQPEELFRSAHFLSIEDTSCPYAPSPDGQRFLVAQRTTDQSTSRIRIVKNWYAEFDESAR
jgi:Tol biopolymer transport system component/DNA-binding winged helix-turn-helix (wHTH) protein